MKLFCLIITITVIFKLPINAQNIYEFDKWTFKEKGSSIEYNAQVPGTIHTDLYANRLIEDPYFRTNENKVQWIDKSSWEYITTFANNKVLSDADVLILTFEGLDTYADIFLNDSLLLSVDNMFLKHEIPIYPSNLNEFNVLKIVFKSPVMAGLEKLKQYGLKLPADNDQSETGGMGENKVSVFTRKAGYHFGWDWGPRIVTSGIWRRAYIKIIQKAYINHIYLKQFNVTTKKADLKAIVSLNCLSPGLYNLTVSLNGLVLATKPLNITNEATSNFKSVITEIPFTIINPDLWWPNGHGNQKLYPIEIKVALNNEVIESTITNIGLRNLKLIRKKDTSGESFFFQINDKPIFAKGANYIPNDIFLSRVTPSKYDSVIKSALAANINMLRVWGGGIYENDYFYDLCDKHGILIWQDFMFACAMYPGDSLFLKSVEKEAACNIIRLRNHPSIVLWCGNNEIEQAWAQYEEGKGWGWKERYNKQERAIIWKAYDTIFHHILPGQVKRLNPEVPYWHSSPSAGMGLLANHTNTSGDMHYWGVWHGNEPISAYRKYKARFMSEYGFQSFPEFESIKKFTIPDDWDIQSEVMLAHQRSNLGNKRILEYLQKSYHQPKNFEDLLYVVQLLQAEAMKTAIESHRSAMPYCMGSLYWQLNDCWPAASWSGIDYYGRWKAMHYFVKEAFKKEIISVANENDTLRFTAISDLNGGSGSLRINLMDFYGNSLWNRMVNVTIPVNGAKVIYKLPLKNLPVKTNLDKILISASLIRNNNSVDSDIFYFVEPKDLSLPLPDIDLYLRQKSNDLYELQIKSKNLTKNIMLVSEGNAFSFSDNFFDILPGETKAIIVHSKLSFDEVERKLSYIHLQGVEH